MVIDYVKLTVSIAVGVFLGASAFMLSWTATTLIAASAFMSSAQASLEAELQRDSKAALQNRVDSATAKRLRSDCEQWRRNAKLTPTETTQAGAASRCLKYRRYIETGSVKGR
ncbi:hypothetical protein V5738_08870 [Salinisphaera sp. SPP-AMP-43]|uniref:hypothetical protein n=1 Tax=Salinisphaera sp. SPP-AMP-43 TaxID=3121288 RepID=UPI003C6DEA9F